ncbi:MAG: response regulator transcription factor [Burkholderiales bacterium]|nr:response regulator transcription factor [Burkholderiales bacterium]MCW5620631.1 response regulator transcription factor [Burkholderiales bacterium]
MRPAAQRQQEETAHASPSSPVSVLIAAAQAVVRSGYRHILEQAGDHVAGEATNTPDLLACAEDSAVAVVLLDLFLPPMGGLDATRRLAQMSTPPCLLLFAASSDGDLASRALDAGALGFISRDSEPETVVEAVRVVAKGRPFLTHDIMQQVALQRVSSRSGTLASLSTREFEIFRLIAEGKPVPEIARLLELSPRSVANYQTHIKRKLRLTTTAELVHLAIRRGVIRISEA